MSSVYARATNRSAVATSAANAGPTACSCEEEPEAVMSNGDPPPESAFESWLLPMALDCAAGLLSGDDATGCTALVGCVLAVVPPVALGSTRRPPVDVLEGSSSSVSVEVLVVVAGLVVVWLGAVVVEVEEGMVVTVTPGQRAWMPRPF